MTTTEQRPINVIANEICKNWIKPNYGAEPYLGAMMQINSINDMYYADTAKSVVIYFLANAQTWRGDVAKRIKLELKQMCK